MSDLQLSVLGLGVFRPKNDDRILTYEGKGVSSFNVRVDGGSINLENLLVGASYIKHTFPVLGKSLPCVFTLSSVSNANYLYIHVEEYGAIPDPDYFKITDLDEDGLPIYADTDVSAICLYKKPIVDGNTFADRILLKTVDNTPENRMLYKIPESIEIGES